MVEAGRYLLLGGIVFGIGVMGVCIRRNVIVMFMSIELMLNGVNISLVGISRGLGDIGGQVLVFFILAVAAAEAGVGLAIIISLYRRRHTVNGDEADIMKW